MAKATASNLSLLDAAHEKPPRRITVIVLVLLSLFLGSSLLALLFYRAAVWPTPNRILIVRADRGWDGAQIRVEGGQSADLRLARIERAGNYAVPFFLWPGNYTLHVTSQGTEVYSRAIELGRERITEVDLTETGASTRPTTNETPGSISGTGGLTVQ